MSRCRDFSRTLARISYYFARSCDAGGHRLADFAVTRRLRLTFMMRMSAAQKRHFIKNVFLEPFEPEINDRRHKKRNHLGENQAADNDKTKRTARRGVVTKPERKRHRAHERSERGHHDGPKALQAGFVNRLSQTQSFVDSFQRKIDHKDSILLHDAEQKKQTNDAIKRQA